MQVCLVSYAMRITYSEQPTILLARRHLNAMILTTFENLNFSSNIFQKNTQLYSFYGPSNYLYLFKNHRQTFVHISLVHTKSQHVFGALHTKTLLYL